MTIHDIRQALRFCNYSKVAEAAGVHPNTVRAIANGTMTNPTLSTLQKIEAVLNAKPV